MQIAEVRAAAVAVPLEAPLRHANGCHWGRFVRTIVEVGTGNGIARWGECIAVDGGYLSSGVSS